MKKKLAIACCSLLAWVVTLGTPVQTGITEGASSNTSRYLFEPFDVVVITFVASAFYFLFIRKNSER
ncbi:hypothetical protein QTN47_01120 [Danxiaibacter flavus]|uniref:Uncharacterized protein n=1 Tax=Danxiaibacter flavus TaxID=3049108 RepID=A0ABV3Z886_9BACT|nr:hypothetical protein QNM32_01120 [Chitinophagaceae bacterium DXS]